MKVLEINSCFGGSTGGIMSDIAEIARQEGIEVITASPRSRDSLKKKNSNIHFYFGPWLSIALGARIAFVTGYDGCAAYMATANLIYKIKQEAPDIIHLHNLHNSVVNLSMLFKALKRMKIKIVWTLHDCWSFTGHCPYYEMIGCEKWKTGCVGCPQYQEYPFTNRDKAAKMFHLKRKLYGSGMDITFVCPSQWLQNEFNKSFLSKYPSRVIYNGVNLDRFQLARSEKKSAEKYIVLGVASPWSKRKGVDIFTSLPKLLGDKYQIVMVGVDETIEKKLPDTIKAIQKTKSVDELIELYQSADVFVNPTRDEVLGLVNIEANACGVPVITFDSGGSPECINEKSGVTVPKNNIKELVREIKKVCENKTFVPEECVKNSMRFNKQQRCLEYVALYKELLHE